METTQKSTLLTKHCKGVYLAPYGQAYLAEQSKLNYEF